MDKQVPTLYENSGYQFERRERKTLILDIEDNTSAAGGSSTCLSGNDQLFAVELHEPLRIDKLSDIYLESFITFNCFRPNCTTSPVGGKMAFIVDIAIRIFMVSIALTLFSQGFEKTNWIWKFWKILDVSASSDFFKKL